MKLIIGGYAQGKLNYVLEKYDVKPSNIWDGKLPENTSGLHGTVVINHLHNWIKLKMSCDNCPKEELLHFIENYPDCVIISDEVGNGIVPIEPFEREYREQTGRILIELAKKAEEVERVICGISQKIK